MQCVLQAEQIVVFSNDLLFSLTLYPYEPNNLISLHPIEELFKEYSGHKGNTGCAENMNMNFNCYLANNDLSRECPRGATGC